jgi:hypothetical protein
MQLRTIHSLHQDSEESSRPSLLRLMDHSSSIVQAMDRWCCGVSMDAHHWY